MPRSIDGQSPPRFRRVGLSRIADQQALQHLSAARPDETQKAGGPASNLSEGGIRTCCTGKRSRTKTAGGAVGIRRRMVFELVAALRKRFEQRALNQHLTTNHIERDHLTSGLQTDYVDEWRLHSVGSLGALDDCFAPDEAIHAMIQARDEGLIRYLSISGHTDPQV
jgi:hypothetical protein